MSGAYYGNVNPDLLRWTPLAARDVLEIGCGEGALAEAYLRRNPAARYTAVEAEPAAAERARGRVSRLVADDFLRMDEAELDALGQFDAVVMGDVLEHLADTGEALRRVRARMRPHAWLALSVPNVGHWSALANLISGRWPAHDSGLFDRTHLRWFTLASLQEALSGVGLETARARPRNFLVDEAGAARWLPALARAAEAAGVEPQGVVNRARALQWVVSARHADVEPPPQLHVHFAAMTPAFLDVRMRLPAEALASDASLAVTYAEKEPRLPALPPGTPKVAVVQRLALASAEVARRYVAQAQAAGWVVACEIDDHPDLIGQVQRSDVGERLKHLLRAAHAVQTSTPRLAAELRGLNPEVAVFANALLELPPARPSRAGGPVRVFHGALNREGFSARVAAALGGLDRPDVDFLVMHDRAFFDALPTTRKAFLPASGHAAYLEAMAGCDIVLSPLEGAAAELHKSDIKFVEASACGAAFLGSRPVYGDTVEDERTGLIADRLEDWPRRLRALVDDPALRRSLAEAAGDYVRRERMLASQVEARAAWLRALWRDRAALGEAAARRAEAAAAP